MNVLFVSTDYVRSGMPTTGFPAYMYRISQALITMGHTPVILAIGTEDYHRFDNGIEVYSVYVPNIKYSDECLSYTIYALKSAWIANKKIGELAKEKDIDIIQFTSLRALGLFYRRKIPAVVRLSSYARIAYQAHVSIGKKQTEVMALLERLSIKGCSAVYAPCSATAERFGADVHRKVYVLETPFLNDVIKYDYCYVDKLAGKKYLLFFGILTMEKGILLIAEILKKFFEKYQEYYFVFVGRAYEIDGKHAAGVLKEAAGEYKDQVILFDPLPHEQLYPIIMRAEFVVLPYLYDNLPNACLEAMSFAKIVVGIDGGSFEQVIVHEENGVLCRPNDAKDLIDKIDYVMSLDENAKRRMERNAKKRIEALRPEIAVKKLLRFYSAVIDHCK